jgi:CYTH domain-containing protein
MEIERKFLVKELPDDLNYDTVLSIEQCYISISPEIRLRKITNTYHNYIMNHNYYLTVKSDGDLEREEFEIQITREQYESLLIKHDGSLIRKNRYKYPISFDAYNLYAEIDNYYGHLSGLQIVEVEFPNNEVAKLFSDYIPEWFSEEVTYDKQYKNKNLALK